jgi:hypothetical protein
VDPLTLAAIIVVAIVAIFALYEVHEYITIVLLQGVHMCSICGQRFTTCGALAAHIASAHPDVWAKIKDKYECALPPGPFDWLKWVAVGVVGAVGLILLVELVRAVRR